MQTRLYGLAVVIPVVLFAACGGDKPKPKTPDDTTTAPASSATATNRLPPNPPDSPRASAVKIADEIIKACGIAAPDAYFAFDSAHLRPEDSKVLDQVVTCFMTGPLKGRKMQFLGHADPRGGSDYNMTLGQSRADSVKQYVNDHGMDASRTDSSSRGAMDATGTDEPSWARDRRVDILLAQ
jgi:peptidoglycan-associated lipoprotein